MYIGFWLWCLHTPVTESVRQALWLPVQSCTSAGRMFLAVQVDGAGASMQGQGQCQALYMWALLCAVECCSAGCALLWSDSCLKF